MTFFVLLSNRIEGFFAKRKYSLLFLKLLQNSKKHLKIKIFKLFKKQFLDCFDLKITFSLKKMCVMCDVTFQIQILQTKIRNLLFLHLNRMQFSKVMGDNSFSIHDAAVCNISNKNFAMIVMAIMIKMVIIKVVVTYRVHASQVILVFDEYESPCLTSFNSSGARIRGYSNPKTLINF